MGNSPLGRVPKQVRDIIYKFVLFHEPGITTGHAEKSYQFRQALEQATPDHFLAITGTCRQAYTEVSLVPFAINVFRIEPPMQSQLLVRDNRFQIQDLAKVPLGPITITTDLSKLAVRPKHIRSLRHVVINCGR